MAGAQGTNREYADGDLIFRERLDADEMYIIKSGNVKITKNMYGIMVKISSLGPGALFGEMALIDGSPRSASAIAVGKVEVEAYDRDALLALIKSDPEFALKMLKEMSSRLRHIDAKLTDLVAKGRLPKEEAASIGEHGFW